MKIRLTSDSIRLRIRKSGLEGLAKEGAIREELHFGPGQKLAFELRVADVPDIRATFSDGCLSIALPTAVAQRWADTEQVGLEHRQVVEGNDSLHLLIEKDFPCKHRPGEDKADTFQELARKTSRRLDA